MERMQIHVIFEGKEIEEDKHEITLSKDQANKSNLLIQLLATAKDKNIRNVRLKFNCPAQIFPAIISYLSSPVESCNASIPDWEINWLKTLDKKYVLDALVVSSHLQINRLCRLLYLYLEKASENESDFVNQFSLLDHEVITSPLLTEIERQKLKSVALRDSVGL
jgi:hypothetical protein